MRLRLLAGNLDDPEHPSFHMEEQMAVKRPTSRGVSGDGDGDPLGRFDDDRMLTGEVGTAPFSRCIHIPCKCRGCSIIVSFTKVKRRRSP